MAGTGWTAAGVVQAQPPTPLEAPQEAMAVEIVLGLSASARSAVKYAGGVAMAGRRAPKPGA